MFFFALNFFLVAVFSFGQLNYLFVFQGTQINLALVAILVFSLFEKDWLRRSALILLAALVLSFEPVLGLDTVLVVAILFLSVFLLDILKWEPALNIVLTVFIATVLTNAGNFNVGAILTETILSLLFAIPLALLMNLVFSRFKN